MATPALEALLREALDRLRSQEERTAALESALRASRPALQDSLHTLMDTPGAHGVETPVVSRPRPFADTPVPRPAPPRLTLLEVLSGIGAATGTDFLAKLTQSLCAAGNMRAALVAVPHPCEANSAQVLAAWVGGQGAEPFAFPAGGALVRELLSGGRAFAPTAARDRYAADPLLVLLKAEAFAAEPLFDARVKLLGFLAVADGRSFAADSDIRPVLKALAPRAAAEVSRLQEDAARDERLAKAEQRVREAEGVLRGATRVAATGRIAAGLAHDFNNLLGVIAGNADLIRESFPDGDPRRDTTDLIARTAQTIGGMNRKLLDIGRAGPERPAPLEVVTSLRALEPILRRLTGKGIPLTLDLAPDLPLISADATQFERVVLNLVLNARDAVETAVKSRGGDAPGAIAIRAARVAVEPGRAGWPADRPPGGYVALTVSDTGCGMPAEVRAKMFDLYFTTKGDRGTGIGLATVLEAVTAARGHIEVESEPGWGTQIRIYWPQLAELPPLRVR